MSDKDKKSPEQERKDKLLALTHLVFLMKTHDALPVKVSEWDWRNEFRITLASYKAGAEETVRTRMANIAKALRQSYFRVEKDMEGDTFELKVPLRDTGWTLNVNCPKEEVCERRVVGTKTVEKPVYETFVRRHESVVEDIVEWDCTEPLLASAS